MEKVFGYRYGEKGFLLVGSEEETKSMCQKYNIDPSFIDSRPIRIKEEKRCRYSEDRFLFN